MGAERPDSVAFAISGRVTRADLPVLCDRACVLLRESGAESVHCDVRDAECDAVTVDALARLQLAALRSGCRMRLRGACPDLLALLVFMGLDEVLIDERLTRGGTMTNRLESEQTTIRANDVDLCVQTFGNPSSPSLLLIAGAASSMDWWEDELCERLAAGPRYVVRYDLRDTGQSTSYEPGAPPYNGQDLVADAVGVLDGLGIDRAHVVGISMGGGLAQHLALDHPQRVASLTLVSTSPGGPGGPDGAGLPPMSDALASVFSEPAPEPDWSDRSAVIDFIAEGQRPFAGSHPLDEDELRVLVARVVDRTKDIAASMTNHWILESGGEPARPRLGELSVPTLVLHGTEDPLFPYAHGEALAAEIPGARLEPLEGVGHEMPPRAVWDRFVDVVVEHTAER